MLEKKVKIIESLSARNLEKELLAFINGPVDILHIGYNRSYLDWTDLDGATVLIRNDLYSSLIIYQDKE